MDTIFIIRIGFALVLALVLAYQARGMVEQPHRRRAFWLAALAFVFFTAFNLSIVYSESLGAFQSILAIAGFVLFLASFASLFMSFRSGEHKANRQRLNEAARAFREERERVIDERKKE